MTIHFSWSIFICSVNSYWIGLNDDYVLVSINIYCKLLIISGKIPWHFNFCINYSEAFGMYYHGNSILMNLELQSTTNSMVSVKNKKYNTSCHFSSKRMWITEEYELRFSLHYKQCSMNTLHLWTPSHLDNYSI